MRTATELHSDHIELISDISFINQEIGFLLKLIKKESSLSSNDTENTKALTAYELEFRKCLDQLSALKSEILTHEKNLSLIFKDDLIHFEKTRLKDEDKIIAEYYDLQKKYRTLKESLYSYITCYSFPQEDEKI